MCVMLQFITDGGLSHLFDILASRKLEQQEGSPWNDVSRFTHSIAS